jgi:hypothetical protein
MSKVHTLQPKVVLTYSGSILSSQTVNSGSFSTLGYKTMRGMIYAGCQMTGCAVRVMYNIVDVGTCPTVTGSFLQTNSTCATIAASGASGFDYPIYGTSACIVLTPGTCNVNPLHTVWWMIPG